MLVCGCHGGSRVRGRKIRPYGSKWVKNQGLRAHGCEGLFEVEEELVGKFAVFEFVQKRDVWDRCRLIAPGEQGERRKYWWKTCLVVLTHMKMRTTSTTIGAGR